MKILGIDPGLRLCGYACIDANPNGQTLLEAGIFRTDSNSPLEERLNQIAADISTLLDRFQPATVAVEQLYSHYAHPRTAILMGHARGVILQKCAQAGIEVKNYSATKIKKSVTGNGSAGKTQVQRSIQALLNLLELPEPNDVADAIAAALCCANALKIQAYST